MVYQAARFRLVDDEGNQLISSQRKAEQINFESASSCRGHVSHMHYSFIGNKQQFVFPISKSIFEEYCNLCSNILYGVDETADVIQVAHFLHIFSLQTD